MATKEASEDHARSAVFRAPDPMVLDRSTSSGTTVDLSTSASNRVVSPNFRYKVHHLASAEVQGLRVLGVEVAKVRERSLVSEVAFTTQTYQVVTSQSSRGIVRGYKGSELLVLGFVELLLETVYEERSVH